MARGSGVEHAETVGTLEDLKDAFSRATERSDVSVLVAKVEAVGPPGFAMDVGLLENRFQFERYIKGLRSRQ